MYRLTLPQLLLCQAYQANGSWPAHFFQVQCLVLHELQEFVTLPKSLLLLTYPQACLEILDLHISREIPLLIGKICLSIQEISKALQYTGLKYIFCEMEMYRSPELFRYVCTYVLVAQCKFYWEHTSSSALSLEDISWLPPTFATIVTWPIIINICLLPLQNLQGWGCCPQLDLISSRLLQNHEQPATEKDLCL